MEINGNIPRIIRFMFDAGMVTAVIGLAFYAGRLAEKVYDLDEATRTRGRVQISIEADTRLTLLESEIKNHERRITKLEHE